MARQELALLPDTSRLFLYNTGRDLEPEEETLLRMKLEPFLDQWAAHGSELTVGYEIRYRRFLVIAVDDSRVGPSGCSIDASTQFLRGFSLRTGIEILESPEVSYRTAEGVESTTRGGFQALAKQGAVNASTIVFDQSLTRLGELRAGRWEIPARESWHSRAFDLREMA